MARRRPRRQGWATQMVQALSDATTHIWRLTSRGDNPWWKMLTVPAAIIGISAVWLAVLSLVATVGLAIVGCYVLAAIVLLLIPGRLFRLRRLF